MVFFRQTATKFVLFCVHFYCYSSSSLTTASVAKNTVSTPQQQQQQQQNRWFFFPRLFVISIWNQGDLKFLILLDAETLNLDYGHFMDNGEYLDIEALTLLMNNFKNIVNNSLYDFPSFFVLDADPCSFFKTLSSAFSTPEWGSTIFYWLLKV